MLIWLVEGLQLIFIVGLFLNSIINLAPEMLKKLHGKSVFHDELEVPFH